MSYHLRMLVILLSFRPIQIDCMFYKVDFIFVFISLLFYVMRKRL